MMGQYPTIADAAAELGVSAKAIRGWIDKKIVDPPPVAELGTRSFLTFPPEYMKTLKRQLEEHREAKRREKEHLAMST